MVKNYFSTKPEDKGKRLDLFLSEKTGLTRSQVQKLVKKNLVLVNGSVATKAGQKLNEKDVVEIKPTNNEQPRANLKSKKEETKKIKIDLIKETRHYLVINKPAGLLIHPTQADEPDTLVNWLLKKYPKIKNVGDSSVRPGIVHRLDKEASGVLVTAKTQEMFEHLKRQFKKREVEKEYTVLVYGNIECYHDIIDFEIDRGKDGRMVSRPKTNKLSLKNVLKIQPGKEAKTEFWVEKKFVRFTLLRVKIHTGRTHQIRVHMFAYGHPVVGDPLYFNKKLIKKSDQKLDRLFLHASRLCFEDLKGEKVCFEAELPKKLKKYLKNLK